MNMKYLTFLILLLLVLFPSDIKAYYEVTDDRCTTSLKRELQKEYSDINYRLSFDNDNKTYTIYFYNVNKNIDIMLNDKKISSERVDNITPGIKLSYKIVANNSTYCNTYNAGNLIISVPYYNKYSESELCEGLSNIAICKENANITLTESKFKEQIEKYKKDKEKEDKKEPEKIKEDTSFNLYDLLMDNVYYIVAILIVLISVITAIIIIKNNKEESIL